jgi:DNA-3-methyladenine glycosylase
MRRDRPRARRDVDLGNGPGKLCAALGITGADDGLDLCDPTSRVRLLRDDVEPPDAPGVTTRIGITRAVEHPWRYVVDGHRGVSRGRPSGLVR